MLDLTVNEKQLDTTAKVCRERGIVIPTLAQMKDPARVPARVKDELKGIGLWDVHPRNLFRITWKNEPVAKGGGFGGVNYLELPRALTGAPARIIGLAGKWFPTGAHKVGATFGCLAPRLVTGQFDPAAQKAVWPSTGNFCRGGAYNSALLGCASIAILPEGMSRERFEWLARVAGEIIATPGCESNVKEIFDKCWELRRTRGADVVIFNQFEELGNYLWHHEVTGSAAREVLARELGPNGSYAGIVLSSGSAGTLASGDALKKAFPLSKIAVAEALQCPTILENGYGGHRIEGIGDKHVPWIHNVRNTDMAIAVDDEDALRVVRLFNEPEGRARLVKEGVDEAVAGRLDLVGISGAANMIAAIKLAKYYELGPDDVVLTVFTDSMELYGSRLDEMRRELGPYTAERAAVDHALLRRVSTDALLELTFADRRRVHNLKYYTWVEQQQRDIEELNRQWRDSKGYWEAIPKAAARVDELIESFNARVGLS